jgi:hypothetical protein
MTRLQRLADALLADRNSGDTDRSDIKACWACGYTFRYKDRRDDLNGRFDTHLPSAMTAPHNVISGR